MTENEPNDEPMFRIEAEAFARVARSMQEFGNVYRRHKLNGR